MKDKHVRIRIEQCLALAKASNCPRRKFGALLLDPERNVVLMDGYNGGPRGGGELCGGDECLRDTLHVESGTRMEIGCHHAEMNVICNCAASGVATKKRVDTRHRRAVHDVRKADSSCWNRQGHRRWRGLCRRKRCRLSDGAWRDGGVRGGATGSATQRDFVRSA